MAIEQRGVSPWGFAGLIGMVAMLFLYTVGSFLVAPLWGTGVLLGLWLVLFAITCRWFMPHPRRTLVMPVVAFALWFGAIAAGGFLLDWSP